MLAYPRLGDTDPDVRGDDERVGEAQDALHIGERRLLQCQLGTLIQVHTALHLI
jgi:hypothetical protein